MKIAITASDNSGFEAKVDSRFGRAPYFTVVDTDTEEIEFIENDAVNASHGAGVSAAQTIADLGVSAVISGNFGPRAFSGLQQADLNIYSYSGGTVKSALDAFKKGALQEISNPTNSAHNGIN